MAEDLLAKLKANDPLILTDVVRQDQRSPSFEITEWSVKRLSDKGIMNPGGLWLLSGAGHDNRGSRAWSVALKVFHRPEQQLPPSDAEYWKREILWAQSELLESLPERIKAPRFYRIEETPEGAWLWMEHVEDHHAEPWGLDDYAFAARQLGYWNGLFVTGKPLPTQPWLARQHYRSWLSGINPEQVWQFPLHQKHISDDIQIRYGQLWTQREMFFNVLEKLPQTFSHFDSQRRNLFIRRGKDERNELVLVDWAACGLGPLGAELCGLVGMSTTLLEWPSTDMSQLDAKAFESYVHGLSEAGWSGKVDFVRLGYVAWLATWLGCAFPTGMTWWCSVQSRTKALQQFGIAEEDLYLRYLPILSYCLDCADEARSLIKKLGFS